MEEQLPTDDRPLGLRMAAVMVRRDRRLHLGEMLNLGVIKSGGVTRSRPLTWLEP